MPDKKPNNVFKQHLRNIKKIPSVQEMMLEASAILQEFSDLSELYKADNVKGLKAKFSTEKLYELNQDQSAEVALHSNVLLHGLEFKSGLSDILGCVLSISERSIIKPIIMTKGLDEDSLIHTGYINVLELFKLTIESSYKDPINIPEPHDYNRILMRCGELHKRCEGLFSRFSRVADDILCHDKNNIRENYKFNFQFLDGFKNSAEPFLQVIDRNYQLIKNVKDVLSEISVLNSKLTKGALLLLEGFPDKIPHNLLRERFSDKFFERFLEENRDISSHEEVPKELFKKFLIKNIKVTAKVEVTIPGFKRFSIKVPIEGFSTKAELDISVCKRNIGEVKEYIGNISEEDDNVLANMLRVPRNLRGGLGIKALSTEDTEMLKKVFPEVIAQKFIHGVDDIIKARERFIERCEAMGGEYRNAAFAKKGVTGMKK